MDESAAFDLQSAPGFMEFMKRLFTADFMPHGHCFFWRPDILWLHVISDFFIALAYYSIPLTLLYFVIRRKNVPFHGIFLMFGAFIFLCGTTHVASIWTMWVPSYRIEGVIKLVTALVSMITAVMIIPIAPKAIAFPSMEQLIGQLSSRTRELEKINNELKDFTRLALGREEKVLELKREINKLSRELGREEPFQFVGQE